MKKNILSVLAILFISLISFAQYAFAVGSAGFENATFSAKALGQSNAVVAQADEPAAISYNPAGIANLPGFQFQPNLSLISSFTYYKSSIQPDTTSSGTIVPIPTGYMTLNPGDFLDDRIAFGIGSDSPFGLSNKYDGGSGIVHYTGWVNYLKMYTIKPTVSFKLFDWLSIGGGPIWYRVMDYGGIQAYPNRLVVVTSPDGQVRLNLAGNHWGWQVGALAKPHKMHQFGFYFRSPVVIQTRGLAKVENSGFTTGGRFETGVDEKLPLPLNFTFAYAFKPNDKATVETDFGYTKWSIFKRANVNHNPTNVTALDNTILTAIGPADKDYSNGFSAHLGGNYKFTDRFTLMGGSLFYWKVVPKDHFIPAVPDSHRLAFSIGTSYKISKYLVADLSYFTLFVLHRKIDNTIGNAVSSSVDGKYRGYLQELTVSLTYKWDDLFKRFGRNAGIGEEKAAISEKPAVT